MSEQYLLAILARARSSKGGLVLVILGVLILFAFLVFALVSVAGNVILMVTGSGPVVDFLDTGWGVLIGLAIAVIVILLGVAFLVRATPQPITEESQAQVRGVEQEREQAQTDKRALRQELEQTKKALEQARVDGGGFGAHTIAQEDTQAVIERLQAEVEQLKAQPGDEELKDACFQVSAECYQFVRDHGGTELGDYLDPEVRRRNDEVMLEYEESLGGRVNGLLRKLERRGWWQPETVEPKKRKHIEDPGFLSDVQDIARELNAIGHEH
jgi:low affinity Fe/Cu permease